MIKYIHLQLNNDCYHMKKCHAVLIFHLHVPKLRVIKVTLNWHFVSNPFYKLKIESHILKDTNCN